MLQFAFAFKMESKDEKENGYKLSLTPIWIQNAYGNGIDFLSLHGTLNIYISLFLKKKRNELITYSKGYIK